MSGLDPKEFRKRVSLMKKSNTKLQYITSAKYETWYSAGRGDGERIKGRPIMSKRTQFNIGQAETGSIIVMRHSAILGRQKQSKRIA